MHFSRLYGRHPGGEPVGTLFAEQELFLAALDPQADVSVIDLSTGMDELKRRLEILLGAKPEAPLDEGMREEVGREAETLARKEKMARAGGQLLGAAFAFLSEMFPEREETAESLQMAQAFRERLSRCMDRGDDGSLRMTVTLPDESVLDTLANSLARITGSG